MCVGVCVCVCVCMRACSRSIGASGCAYNRSFRLWVLLCCYEYDLLKWGYICFSIDLSEELLSQFYEQTKQQWMKGLYIRTALAFLQLKANRCICLHIYLDVPYVYILYIYIHVFAKLLTLIWMSYKRKLMPYYC